MHSLAKEGTRQVDAWSTSELSQLRDDLEDSEVRRDAAETSADQWYRKHEAMEQSLSDKLREAQVQGQEDNLKLRDKIVVFMDLFQEYENIIDMYVHHTGVKLTTNNLKKILELKQKGDIIP
jgi:hypothetical protein